MMNIERRLGLRATMDDGVELVADAWLPAGNGLHPVLLQRLPYGRSVASTPVLPHPEWFARQGFAVVVQDARGRGESGGTFRPFLDEAKDGAASIEWAARLPFCDGQVATYGFSYQGLNQLYAAAQRPPSLKAIAPMMCAPDPYEGWTYEGGALRWPFVCFWAAQLAGQDGRRPPLPFSTSAVPINRALGPTPPPWFDEWLDHPFDDEYWAARRPDLAAINVPAFSVAGWFDDFSGGTGELVGRLDAEAWFGPWSHMPWGTVHSGVEFGEDASPTPIWPALVRFFNRAFGRPGDPPPATVRYFVINEGWRESPSWPPAALPRRWATATPDGGAQSRWGDGALDPGERRTDPHPPVVLVAEPQVPVPGGPIDFQDESSLHDRRDIACFDTEAFHDDLVLAGTPTVHVTTRCDRPRHDLVATLCVVSPNLSARVVTSYASRRLEASEPGAPIEWSLTLRPVAVRIPRGSRLRLTLSGSRFPCYDVNAHTAEQSPATEYAEQTVATIEILGAAVEIPTVPTVA